MFSGLDVRDAVQPGHVLAVSKDSSLDVGRKAFKLMEKLRIGQQAFTIIEKVEYSCPLHPFNLMEFPRHLVLTSMELFMLYLRGQVVSLTSSNFKIMKHFYHEDLFSSFQRRAYFIS